MLLQKHALVSTGRARTVRCLCQQQRSERVTPVSSRRQLLGLGASLAVLGWTQKASAQATLADLLRPFGGLLDVNGDGKLDVEELRNAAAAASGTGTKPARETVRERIVPVVDFNGDGVVSTDEFLRGMSLELPASDDAVFGVLDQDGNGKVSLVELRSGLGDLGTRGDAVISAAFDLARGKQSAAARKAALEGPAQLSREQVDKALDYIATGVLGDLLE